MVPVKKIIGLLVLAGLLCGTVVGCGTPTTAPKTPAATTKPA
jgi:hypothetical protein